jgi:exonuclease SbcD
MKILHTADWHIGQLFHEYDRTFEHRQFLNWLTETIHQEEIDVLLISGDIFDLSNPSAASVRLFYTFLNQATRKNPNLQIVVTAGNHDSAARLESPKPLLESSNIHIIGVIEKDEDGKLDYEKITIPLKDKSGKITTWCLAVPFLRIGDYPTVTNSSNPYTDGVTAFYQEAYDYILTKKQKDQTVIAMGHLHAQSAEVTDMDKNERLIMGGVECISASSFPKDIAYVALGHIHKAQRIGNSETIRYSGSPIPMSFSERNYKHQVIVFEINNNKAENIHSIEIPVTIPVLSIPEVHARIEDVLNELSKLPTAVDGSEPAPYLEVRVLEDRPDPNRKHQIAQAIEGKNVRLATINLKSSTTKSTDQKIVDTQKKLDELKPADIFMKIYESQYGEPASADLLKLFNQVNEEVAQSDEL